MKRNRGLRRVKISADGEGSVSRAGVALLRELTVATGLADGWTDALLNTYKAFPAAHLPGRVLADLAVVIADGGDELTHLATVRDHNKLFGVVASDATAWGRLARVDEEHLARLQAVRARARERARAAGGEPELRDGLVIDIDATITIAHSEKENPARTWKKTFGFHPLLAYLDRLTSPAAKASPGSSDPETPGRTRPLTTSRSWAWRWLAYPNTPDPGPT